MLRRSISSINSVQVAVNIASLQQKGRPGRLSVIYGSILSIFESTIESIASGQMVIENLGRLGLLILHSVDGG